MTGFQKEVATMCDSECFKRGHRLYIVKIKRGAVIGRDTTAYRAYFRAWQFLTKETTNER